MLPTSIYIKFSTIFKIAAYVDKNVLYVVFISYLRQIYILSTYIQIFWFSLVSTIAAYEMTSTSIFDPLRCAPYETISTSFFCSLRQTLYEMHSTKWSSYVKSFVLYVKKNDLYVVWQHSTSNALRNDLYVVTAYEIKTPYWCTETSIILSRYRGISYYTRWK